MIVDEANKLRIAGEFKPPEQTKREYLTGLGQAMAYTRDFHYSLLVVPTVADDGYGIAQHIGNVLSQKGFEHLPVGILQYDPATLSVFNPNFELLHPLSDRVGAPSVEPTIENSFWAKWRDASAQEIGLFLGHLYDEGEGSSPVKHKVD